MKIDKEKLQIAMGNAKMTINQLALKSGISRISILAYMNNTRNPKPITVGKIADVLNVKVEDLIE